LIDFLKRFLQQSADVELADGQIDMDELAAVMGCSISKKELFRQALRHRSLLRGNPEAYMMSNERLEYLGDSIVGFLVAEHLYENFPGRDEGFLTRLRAKLVNGRALAERARGIDLGRFIQVSDSLNVDQRNSNSILADAFEAVIGAIYLDQGMDITRAFVEKTVLHHVDLLELAEVKDNFKSSLLEFVQARSRNQPVYEVKSESGPSHDKRFVVAVLIDGKECGRGEDRSKKSAEQIAAKQALEDLLADNNSSGFNES